MVEKPQTAEAVGSVEREAAVETASPPRSDATVSGRDKPATASSPAVHPAAPLVDGLIAVVQDATAPDVIVERVKVLIGDLNSRTRAALDKSAKFGEELGSIAKGNVEAVVASSHAVAEGAETLGRQTADYGNRRAEKAAAALSSFTSAKTPAEMIEIQSDYVRGSVNDAMAQASLFGELWAKTGRDVIEPLSGRYAVAAEKLLIVA